MMARYYEESHEKLTQRCGIDQIYRRHKTGAAFWVYSAACSELALSRNTGERIAL